MSRCPFADWEPIPVESSARRIQPWGVVLHTSVTDRDALRPGAPIEWHFYVGEEGQLTQYRDTGIEADCQMDGNYFDGRGHISIETWDGAYDVWDGRDVGDIPPWTDAQLATIARLFRWLNAEHGIPLRKITAWNGRGIGYHRQFTSDSYPRWNGSHACPGTRRIAQVPEIITLAAQEDDMPLDESDIEKVWFADGLIDAPTGYPHQDTNPHWEPQRFLRNIADAVVYPEPFTKPYYPDDNPITEREATRWTHSRVKQLEPVIEKTAERTAAILDAVGGLDTAAILARIDARADAAAAEREALAAALVTLRSNQDAIAALLVEHADGGLDAAAVVDGVRDLLHQATAPAVPTEETP